jgi:hypothetical protein
MSQVLKENIHQAASIVHRSPRTIRRWIAQGIDIRDATSLEEFAGQVSDHTFGRWGNGARLMGKRGGLRTSDAKRRSSQTNGKRGGRPKDGMLLLRKAIRDGRWVDLENAHDDDLQAIGSALVAIHKEYLFWVGDILNEIEKRHGNDSAKWAIKRSPDPGKFREAMAISQMFAQAIGQRRFNLHWRYYREVALECAKDSKECIEWLQKAEAHHWPLPQMRAEIRLAVAGENRQQTPKMPKQVSAATAINRATKVLKEIAAAKPVDTWSLDETCGFIDDAEPLLEVVGRIHERWKQITQSAETPLR